MRRGRRPSIICPLPLAAQSDPQALLHDIGGNRSLVSVDQRVLVDLLGRDGDLEESTKTLLTRSFTCLVAAYGLMNMKTAPLWIALSISRSATRRFGAPMTMDTSTCHAGNHCWFPPARNTWLDEHEGSAQSRPTSSLCAFGAACTINWHGSGQGSDWLTCHQPQAHARKMEKLVCFYTSACLIHSRDGRFVCV